MRTLIIGNVFEIPMFLYDSLLYGGTFLTVISIGMMLYDTTRTSFRKVWLIVLMAGGLLLVPAALSMIYGLGERIA